MKAKDTLLPAIVIPVGIAFVVVCALVYLNKGKSGKLIATKLKLGAFILSFSWFASSCDPGVTTCYDPAQPENWIDIEYPPNFVQGDTLNGVVDNRTFDYYSYFLIDSVTSAIKESAIVATDSVYNDYNLRFFILLDSSLSKGSYYLDIYGENTAEIKKTRFLRRFSIYIN